jgi:hypothetical protein
VARPKKPVVVGAYLEQKQQGEAADQHFANQLEALRSMSVVVADTGQCPCKSRGLPHVPQWKPQNMTDG